jgi:hypothetical protein
VDDLVLIPIGVALALKLIPPSVMVECRAHAHEVVANGKPVSGIAAFVIVVIWVALAVLCILWAYEAFSSP